MTTRLWEEATAVLREVATASGLALVDDPGCRVLRPEDLGGCMKDAIGRTWQMSTIQLDFNLPERFQPDCGLRRHSASARS